SWFQPLEFRLFLYFTVFPSGGGAAVAGWRSTGNLHCRSPEPRTSVEGPIPATAAHGSTSLQAASGECVGCAKSPYEVLQFGTASSDFAHAVGLSNTDLPAHKHARP